MTPSNATSSTRSSSSSSSSRSTANINSAANSMGEANLQFFRLAEIYASSTHDNHHTITNYNPDEISTNDDPGCPRIELSLQDIIEFNDRSPRNIAASNRRGQRSDRHNDRNDGAPRDRYNNRSTASSMSNDDVGNRSMSSSSSANDSSEYHRAADRIADIQLPSGIENTKGSVIDRRRQDYYHKLHMMTMMRNEEATKLGEADECESAHHDITIESRDRAIGCETERWAADKCETGGGGDRAPRPKRIKRQYSINCLDGAGAISKRISDPKLPKTKIKKIPKKKLKIKKKIDEGGEEGSVGEIQRMAHIAVERNRRRQMNHHLGTLRSLMPASYIQRGDQASVIGGAIEFIKELEQLLRSLELEKERITRGVWKAPADFTMGSDDQLESATNGGDIGEGSTTDVEVKLMGAGSSAVVKVLAQKKAHRLLDVLPIIEEGLRLKIMQINITRIRDSVLYYLYVKVQDAEKLHTAIDIAEAFKRIFMLDSR